MRRRILFYLAGIAISVIGVTAVLAYEVPDEIVIERVKGNKMLNDWVKQVKFAHGFHAIRVPCQQCHHKESDKELGAFVGCRQCHTDDNPNEISGFYRAWHSHSQRSCLGCHTIRRVNGQKNPVGCTTACHKPG